MSQQLPPEIQNLVLKARQLEEQLRIVMTRRQQIKLELLEIESVKEELDKLPDEVVIHKQVGNILIKKDKKSVSEEINDRKETLQLQDLALEKQEANLRKQFESTSRELESALRRYQTGETGEGLVS
ncbi:MAG TPA: prefoldin subunit beta [Geobacterales bacterium]|nr:prefoldin subunit beta [Geobacterales bacterium]